MRPFFGFPPSYSKSFFASSAYSSSHFDFLLSYIFGVPAFVGVPVGVPPNPALTLLIDNVSLSCSSEYLCVNFPRLRLEIYSPLKLNPGESCTKDFGFYGSIGEIDRELFAVGGSRSVIESGSVDKISGFISTLLTFRGVLRVGATSAVALSCFLSDIGAVDSLFGYRLTFLTIRVFCAGGVTFTVGVSRSLSAVDSMSVYRSTFLSIRVFRKIGA